MPCTKKEFQRREFQRWVKSGSEWGNGKRSGNLVRRRSAEWGPDRTPQKPKRGQLRREYKEYKKKTRKIGVKHPHIWIWSTATLEFWDKDGEEWFDDDTFCVISSEIAEPQRTIYSGFS